MDKDMKKPPSSLFASSYTESPDFERVDITYLSFLEQSVERKVVPALKRIQRTKEDRATRARRRRID